MAATTTLEGYRELQLAMRRLPPEASRELRTGLKRAVDLRLVPAARGRARRASGRLAGSIRGYPQARGVMFGSRLIYAPVQEFGGTVVHHGARHRHGGAAGKLRRTSRGADGVRRSRTTSFGRHLIHIKGKGYIYPALRAKRDAVAEDLSNVLVAKARRVGFNAVKMR